LTLSGILTGSKSYGEETLTIAYANKDDRGDPEELLTKYEHDLSWEREINEFANAILYDKPILNGSAYDALDTMKLVFKIYRADKRWSSKWNI
jgi:hypothetical protein